MEISRTGTGATHARTAVNPSLLEHELKLCAGAIALVVSGGAPRVWLVGMRAGRELVRQAITMGHAADLAVRARWWPDEEALDLVVEHYG